MRSKSNILVTTLMLVTASGALVLVGCGQKGNLTLPNDPDFKQRATLPDIIKRQIPLPVSAAQPASTPASAASDASH